MANPNELLDAETIVELTPNDTIGSTSYQDYNAICVDADGEVELVLSDGSTSVTPHLAAGVWHPIRGVRWVKAAGTASATTVWFAK